MTYDDTVYTVTVRVTNDGQGGLVAEIWAVSGESTQKTDEVLFTNRYTPPTQPPVNPPQTGDTAHVGPLMAVFAAAAMGLTVSLIVVWKRSRNA